MKEKLKQLIDKIMPMLRGCWLKFTQTKFYQNKKIFLPISVSLGLIILFIVVGLILGSKKASQVVRIKPSPTPSFTGSANTATPSTDALSQIEQKLIDIKYQINALDVKQSRLAPPTLNFNIKF